METKLKFIITTVTGEKVEQEISVAPPPDPSIPMEAAIMDGINRMMAQYSQVGMMKREGDKFILLTTHQIAKVEVEKPSILIANPAEAERATKGSLIQMP